MTNQSLFAAAFLALIAGQDARPPREPQEATPPGPSRTALTSGVLAIRNVTAITMGAAGTMTNSTVLVRDGRIAAVGRNVAVPPGTRIIDGGGKYLIPGLADMHTHLFSDGEEVHDSAGPLELGVMVANGVTAARLMIGTPEHLALRRAVASGRLTGPQLWVASPQLTGRPSENALVVTSPDEARAAVRTAAQAGYDFIKLTLYITRPVYDGVIDEARVRNIRVAGHVEPVVGLGAALAAQQQIEHLDSFFEEALSSAAPSRESVTQAGVFAGRNWPSIDYVEDRKIDSIAGAVARAGVFVGPTQNVFNTAFAVGETREQLQSRPDWAHWPPRLRQGYLNAHTRYWDPARAPERTEARRRRYVEIRNRAVKAIQDSGGRLLAGSDTPEWFHLYGWGLHRELQALVSAGLTPLQALAAATTNPAAYLGASSEWGRIESRLRADLILLDANPLEDIANTMKIAAVVIGGRVLDRTTLDAMIAAGARATGGSQP